MAKTDQEMRTHARRLTARFFAGDPAATQYIAHVLRLASQGKEPARSRAVRAAKFLLEAHRTLSAGKNVQVEGGEGSEAKTDLSSAAVGFDAEGRPYLVQQTRTAEAPGAAGPSAPPQAAVGGRYGAECGARCACSQSPVGRCA